MHPLVSPLALVIERLVGYPSSLSGLIGHPVMWIGRLIAVLERRWNRSDLPAPARMRRGVLMLLVVVLATVVPAIVLSTLVSRLPWGWVLEAVLMTPLLAQKELARAVRAVGDALDRSLAEGRKAVSHIVGRDPETLDEAGVARAAVESLAESTSDGVVAPLFWAMLLGLPGIAIFKAVNTADSMVGHLNERFADFGWASARLDDLLNWVPARLTALLIAGAALFLTGADSERAWAIALRDARKHESPNAGWPEAAIAGALDIGLGGPRSYEGETVDLPQFGDGRRSLGAKDIHRALDLYATSLNLLLAASLAIGVLALFRVGP